ASTPADNLYEAPAKGSPPSLALRVVNRNHWADRPAAPTDRSEERPAMSKAAVTDAAPAEGLAARLRDRTARICVVGLCYVGLPPAESSAAVGYRVVGFDVDDAKVRRLMAGQSYIGHIPSSRVAQLVGSGKFAATFDPAKFAEVDAIVICVPTPLTDAREP